MKPGLLAFGFLILTGSVGAETWWEKMQGLSHRGLYPMHTPWDVDSMSRLTHQDSTNTTIARCGLGQYTPDNKLCELCPLGKFGSQMGLVLCVDCPAGKYMDHLGGVHCEQCNFGERHTASPLARSSCAVAPPLAPMQRCVTSLMQSVIYIEKRDNRASGKRREKLIAEEQKSGC